MTIKRLLIWGALLALSSVGTVKLHAALAFPYEYSFVSSDSTVSGQLFLDAASSSAGTAADIGPGSYLTFSLYDGYLPPVRFDLTSLNTALDPNFTFAWNSSRITTPLDISVGLGFNDVLLKRQFLNPNNNSPFAPECDLVVYDSIYLSANQNLLNGQVLSSSLVSLVVSESTLGVGGGGIVYDLPLDPGTSGSWLAVAVPEPAALTLAAAVAALAFTLISRRTR